MVVRAHAALESHCVNRSKNRSVPSSADLIGLAIHVAAHDGEHGL